MSTPPRTPAVDAWLRLHREPHHEPHHELHRAHRSLIEKVELSLKEAGLLALAGYDVWSKSNRKPGIGLRHYEIGEKLRLAKSYCSINTICRDCLIDWKDI